MRWPALIARVHLDGIRTRFDRAFEITDARGSAVTTVPFTDTTADSGSNRRGAGVVWVRERGVGPEAQPRSRNGPGRDETPNPSGRNIHYVNSWNFA